jgi:hypothetical protein
MILGNASLPTLAAARLKALLGLGLIAVALVVIVVLTRGDKSTATDLGLSSPTASTATQESVTSTTAAPTTTVEVTTSEPEAFQSTVVLTGGPIPGTYDATARCIAAGESLAIVSDAATDALSAVTVYLSAEPLKSTGAYEGPVELGMDARTPNFTTFPGNGTARIEAVVENGLFTSITFVVEGEFDGGTVVQISGRC